MAVPQLATATASRATEHLVSGQPILTLCRLGRSLSMVSSGGKTVHSQRLLCFASSPCTVPGAATILPHGLATETQCCRCASTTYLLLLYSTCLIRYTVKSLLHAWCLYCSAPVQLEHSTAWQAAATAWQQGVVGCCQALLCLSKQPCFVAGTCQQGYTSGAPHARPYPHNIAAALSGPACIRTTA